MDLTPIARTVFAKDLFATQTTGINIDSVDEETVVCSLHLNAKHLNAKGAVMGGVLFTLADFAFAIAANSIILASAQNTDNTCLQWVSSSSTIHFLTTAKGDTLKATTKRIRQGHTQALFEIAITDSLNRQIALVTTAGTKINQGI